MIKVVFCLPGKTFTNYFLESWSNLLSACPNLGITPTVRWAVSSNVYNVRNLCLKGSPELGKDQKVFNGEISYDYIMWIDSDSVFTNDDFNKLFDQMKNNTKIDILSGLYLKEGGKEFTAVEKIDTDYHERHGKPASLTPSDIKGKTKLIKVDYTGMGFMMVRRGVFESLDYPWFQPLGMQGASGLVNFTGEDASFCIRASQKGYPTYVDPTLVIGHEKSIILR
jgi:hypothetical protein